MKKTFNKKSTLILAAFAATGMLVGSPAFAAGIGDVLAATSTANFEKINNFITAGMYLAGVGFGAAGIFKLRDYMKDDQGRASLKLPVGLLIAASLALAMPSYLKTGVDTTFGTGAAMNTLQGSTLR